MKNTLIDLHNHLFMALERLNDEDLRGGKLDEELKRDRGICNVAAQIVANAANIRKAVELQNSIGATPNEDTSMPTILIGRGEQKK